MQPANLAELCPLRPETAVPFEPGAYPLTDWNWDGQFEDIRPEQPYKNPTKHNAIDVMFYLLERFPDDPFRREQARALLKFSEARFVVWRQPANHPDWATPSVLEQYSCFVPIDGSASKMIGGYLAIAKADGDSLCLAKALALADSITRVQKPDGRLPTFWIDGPIGGVRYDWLNCTAASARALEKAEQARRDS